MTTYDLMTERERLDAVMPLLWEMATALDPEGEFSEIQLASIAYQTANRCASKWRADGLPFEDFVAMTLDHNLAKARESAQWVHSAERMLAAVTAGAR